MGKKINKNLPVWDTGQRADSILRPIRTFSGRKWGTECSSYFQSYFRHSLRQSRRGGDEDGDRFREYLHVRQLDACEPWLWLDSFGWFECDEKSRKKQNKNLVNWISYVLRPWDFVLPPNECPVRVFELGMWRPGQTSGRTSPTDWCCCHRSIHGGDDAKMNGKCAKRVPVAPVPVQNGLPDRKIAEWCRKRGSTTDPAETSSGLEKWNKAKKFQSWKYSPLDGAGLKNSQSKHQVILNLFRACGFIVF